jgi:hypothetical protein
MTRIVSLIFLLFSLNTMAQDTLPEFTAYTRGMDKVIISWTNTYPKVTQISIQRSTDSLRMFKTILTVPDPTVQQNGYLDAKGTNPKMFYRLFVVLDSGKYVFTKTKRPFYDTARKVADQRPETMPENNARQRVVIPENMTASEAELLKEKIKEAIKKEDPKAVMPVEKARPAPEPERFFIVKKRDTVIMQVSEKTFRKFRDSIVLKTKDTMTFKSLDTIVIKPFIPKEVYKPSKYVYTTERDGNVAISLPEAKTTHYSIKFFEDDTDKTFLFDVKQVKETYLVVDKTNFMHAGWFRFELYEDGKLKETHKFFIPKD